MVHFHVTRVSTGGHARAPRVATSAVRFSGARRGRRFPGNRTPESRSFIHVRVL